MNTSPVTDIEIGEHTIRVVQSSDGGWLVVADVLTAMGIDENAFDTASNALDENHMSTAQIACGDSLQQVAIIHENSIFALAFHFDNPEAKCFQEWSVEFCATPVEIGSNRQRRTSIDEMTENELVTRAFSILEARVEAQQKPLQGTN